MTPLSLIFPHAPGRSNDYLPLDELESYLLYHFLERPFPTMMIHQPAGWHHSMTGAQWFVDEFSEHRRVYVNTIGRALAERPGLQVWIYGGLQWYTKFSNVGRPRDENTGQFIAEPQWASTLRNDHYRGVLDTIEAWSDAGVTGWVFDSGSRQPQMIRAWQTAIPTPITGLEAIPMLEDNTVDWQWAENFGIHYHANTRYRNGDPFDEHVPGNATAYAWIRKPPFPTIGELKLLLNRGWSLGSDISHDNLIIAAMGASPDGQFNARAK